MLCARCWALLCFGSCRHDDVIKWKHFPRYWPFMRVIHRGQGMASIQRSIKTNNPYTSTSSDFNQKSSIYKDNVYFQDHFVRYSLQKLQHYGIQWQRDDATLEYNDSYQDTLLKLPSVIRMNGWQLWGEWLTFSELLNSIQHWNPESKCTSL